VPTAPKEGAGSRCRGRHKPGGWGLGGGGVKTTIIFHQDTPRN